MRSKAAASRHHARVKQLHDERAGRLGRADDQAQRPSPATICSPRPEAGAQALQLFDSWCGELSPADYANYVLPYITRTIDIAEAGRRADHPLRDRHRRSARADGDRRAGRDRRRLAHLTSARACDRLGPEIAVQGNLDPIALLRDHGMRLASGRRLSSTRPMGAPVTSSIWATASSRRRRSINVRRLVDFVHEASRV